MLEAVGASVKEVWSAEVSLVGHEEFGCLKHEGRDFPGAPGVRSLCFHCRGHGFDPSQGAKIPHAIQHSQNF